MNIFENLGFISKNLNSLNGYLFAGEVIKNPWSLLNELIFSSVLAALMYFVYYRSYTALTYNKKFNITLVMIAIASTFMMLLIQGDLAVSFGVMGTLSIIRFRTTVKDNRDIGFIFWALVIGLAIGTSHFVIAIIYSLTMAVYLLLTRDRKATAKTYLLIVRGSEYSHELDEFIRGYLKNIRLKAKNLTKDAFELVYDVKIKDPQKESHLTEAILSNPNVISANLLSSNAEVE